MGSFNTTCFASKQTVAPGDPCMVVPILQQSSFEPVQLEYGDKQYSMYGVCRSVGYPTRFWKPIGSFFEAVYDDCGRVTLAGTSANRIKLVNFIASALKRTPVVAQGKNRYHDLPYDLKLFMAEEAPAFLQLCTHPYDENPPAGVDADALLKQGIACWDYIFEIAGEQRMFWQDYTGALRPMNFALMHRAAFDALVARTNAQSDWEGKPYAMRAFVERAVTEARQLFRRRSAIEHLQEALSRGGGSENSGPSVESEILYELAESLLSGEMTEDEFFEEVAPWLAIRYAYAGLLSLNLHFEPMVYAAQDYDNQIGQAFSEFVSQVSRNVTRGRFESSFGCYRDYSVTARSLEVFKELDSAARERDGHLEVVQTAADPHHLGCLRVRFQCTLNLEGLTNLFEEFRADGRVLTDTLSESPGDQA